MAKTKNTRSSALATRADVDAAIEALSPADERRIEKAARYFVRGLGRLTRARSFRELEQEAITAIYTGAENPKAGRHWPTDQVSFVQFFVRTMESIVSHWAEDADREVLDSETVVETEEGETVSLLSKTPYPAPLPDRELIAKEEVAKIMTGFDDDSEAWIVLTLFTQQTAVKERLGSEDANHATANVYLHDSYEVGDAPLCVTCGSLMVRNGSCHMCANCGGTSGCS